MTTKAVSTKGSRSALLGENIFGGLLILLTFSYMVDISRAKIIVKNITRMNLTIKCTKLPCGFELEKIYKKQYLPHKYVIKKPKTPKSEITINSKSSIFIPIFKKGIKIDIMYKKNNKS